MQQDTLEDIVARFKIDGAFKEALPFGSGHINDTYRVVNRWAKYPDYLLQRINRVIFEDVPGLTANIVRVTEHLRRNLPSDEPVLTPVPARDLTYFYRDNHGEYWRLYVFLNNMRSYDLVTNEKMALEGGLALGRFQHLLADLEAGKLKIILPDFHNIYSRRRQFEAAVLLNAAGRLDEISQEMAFLRVRWYRMGEIERLGQGGELPLRVTHNDTKINNILFDSRGKARCVIDLDTVMPGYAAFDFGDAVRTLINTAPEDEGDLEKIDLQMAYFEAFTKGFLSEAAGIMNITELRSLALGVLLLPFMIGLRFLTDHLNGDIYYKTAFPGHNYQRARAQFRLVEKLEAAYPEIYSIIMRAARMKVDVHFVQTPTDSVSDRI